MTCSVRLGAFDDDGSITRPRPAPGRAPPAPAAGAPAAARRRARPRRPRRRHRGGAARVRAARAVAPMWPLDSSAHAPTERRPAGGGPAGPRRRDPVAEVWSVQTARRRRCRGRRRRPRGGARPIPDRIGKARPGQRGEFVLSGGRGRVRRRERSARATATTSRSPTSTVGHPLARPPRRTPDRGRHPRRRPATGIETEVRGPLGRPAQRSVVARRVERLGALELSSAPLDDPPRTPAW